jgi:hypothetical protein
MIGGIPDFFAFSGLLRHGAAGCLALIALRRNQRCGPHHQTGQNHHDYHIFKKRIVLFYWFHR